MSNFPLDPNYFVGGQRVTPIDESEGGPPLAALVNEISQHAQSSVGAIVLSASIDYSAASAAVVAAASRATVTNAGSARAVTLPDFASAPDGWTQTYITLAADDLVVTHAGSDTINGVAGDITLAIAHDWATLTKVPGAVGWFSVSAGSTGSVLIPT